MIPLLKTFLQLDTSYHWLVWSGTAVATVVVFFFAIVLFRRSEF